MSFPRTSALLLLLVPAFAAASDASDASDAAPPAACTDAWAHFNQAWQQQAPDDPGVFAALEVDARTRQLALLERVAREPGDEVERALGGFWRAALDAEAIERAGLAPLSSLLEPIAEARNARDIAAAIAAAHAAGVPLLFRFDVGADLSEPRRGIAYLRQGGLGLPDRDYYLRQDPATGALVQHYRAYVDRLLQLSGSPDASRAAEVDAILDMETRMARASLSLLQLRDPNNSWRRVTLADIDRRFAALDLRGFMRDQGLRGLGAVSLAHDAFFVEANSLVQTLPVASWRAYLRFHLLHAMAAHLPAPYREARHALFDRQIAGREAPPEQATRALAATDAALGELLSAAYRRQWLADADAAAAGAVARGLVDALTRQVDAAGWLGEDARAEARRKLDQLVVAVGADPAPALDGLDAGDGSLAGRVLAAARWQQRRAFARIGDTSRPQPLLGHRVAAWYDPVHNRLAVSAALLAPPLFDGDDPPARQYGRLGALLAHELSHAVGPQGARLDAEGHIRAWWGEAEQAAWSSRVQPLVAQYDAYEALPGVPVDGRRTLPENAADLAGLEIALLALDAARGDAAADHAAFFEAWATLWRERPSAAARRIAAATGLHAPARWRANGPLPQLPEFATAFDCRAGDAMARPEASRVKLWR